MKLFKRRKPKEEKEIKIIWRWEGEEEVQTSLGNSAGTAMLFADPYVEILSVESL